MNEDDEEKTFEGAWGKAKRHADGSITVESVAGKVEIDSDGSAEMQLETITAVSVENIVHLETYSIKEDSTACSHHLVFRGGGEVRFSYSATGKLLEFRATKMSITTTKEGAVILRGTAPDES